MKKIESKVNAGVWEITCSYPHREISEKDMQNILEVLLLATKKLYFHASGKDAWGSSRGEIKVKVETDEERENVEDLLGMSLEEMKKEYLVRKEEIELIKKQIAEERKNEERKRKAENLVEWKQNLSSYIELLKKELNRTEKVDVNNYEELKNFYYSSKLSFSEYEEEEDC